MSDHEGELTPVITAVVEQPIPERSERLSALARRVGGCILGAGIAVAPLAAIAALDHTTSQIEIGKVKAEVSFTGNGVSSVQSGPVLKNAYLDKSWHGVGATVEITDTGESSITDLFTPRQIGIYSALLNDPEQAMSAYKTVLLKNFAAEALLFDAIPALAIGTIAGLGAEVYRVRRRAAGKDALSSRAVKSAWIGGIASGLVASSALAYGISYPRFVDDSPAATQHYAIEQLNGTALEGAYTDNRDLELLIERGVQKGREYYERGKDQSDAYVAGVMNQLSANRVRIALPRADEYAAFLVSDQHDNEAMARILGYTITLEQELSGGRSPSLLLGGGDYGYNIPPWLPEASYLRRIAGLSKLVAFYGVAGNHEGEYSTPVLKEGGLQFIDDEVIATDEASILGMSDPRTTEFLDGTTPSGKEGLDAEQKTGQDAREIAEEEHPTFTLLHEAYAAIAFIGEGYDARTFINGGDGQYAMWREDGVPDVPTSIINYGHWHRSNKKRSFRVLSNSDGTWTVLLESGTAGGAIGSPTAGDYSIPYEPPKQTASFTKVFVNKTSQLVTGLQLYKFYPDGRVYMSQRINIGSVDGQPFKVNANNSSFDAKRKQLTKASR
jgi:hypothetical protein